MAITKLLTSGTTVANSADVVLIDGQAATLVISDGESSSLRSQITISAKTADGKYVAIGKMGDLDASVKQIVGPITFRAERGATAVAIGVDIERA